MTNPATGEAIAACRAIAPANRRSRYRCSRGTSQGWAEMGIPARRSACRRLADALDRFAGHFAKLLMRECGFDEATATLKWPLPRRAARRGRQGDRCLRAGARPPRVPGCSRRNLAPAFAGRRDGVAWSPPAPSAVFALCELTARVGSRPVSSILLQGDTAAIPGLCAGRSPGLYRTPARRAGRRDCRRRWRRFG